MYLAAAMLTGQEFLTKINDPGEYAGQKLEIENPKRFSYMRIVDAVSYGYLIEATKLLQGTEFVS